jgi:hypothetical protein
MARQLKHGSEHAASRDAWSRAPPVHGSLHQGAASEQRPSSVLCAVAFRMQVWWGAAARSDARGEGTYPWGELSVSALRSASVSSGRA